MFVVLGASAHRADVDAGVALDAQLAGEDSLHVAICARSTAATGGAIYRLGVGGEKIV